MVNKSKKGFSLVEVIIALSVIIIVSVCALTIVLSSISTKQSTIDKEKAQYFANDAWECFKASNDENEFIANMLYAEEIDLSFTNGVCEYTSEIYKYTANIEVDYTLLRPTFKITVKDKKDNTIVTFTYKKGGSI